MLLFHLKKLRVWRNSNIYINKITKMKNISVLSICVFFFVGVFHRLKIIKFECRHSYFHWKLLSAPWKEIEITFENGTDGKPSMKLFLLHFLIDKTFQRNHLCWWNDMLNRKFTICWLVRVGWLVEVEALFGFANKFSSRFILLDIYEHIN